MSLRRRLSFEPLRADLLVHWGGGLVALALGARAAQLEGLCIAEDICFRGAGGEGNVVSLAIRRSRRRAKSYNGVGLALHS